MQLEVASLINYDRYIISRAFNRDGILYVTFLQDYTPPGGSHFVFATHTSSSGDFNLVHGDFDAYVFLFSSIIYFSYSWLLLVRTIKYRQTMSLSKHLSSTVAQLLSPRHCY